MLASVLIIAFSLLLFAYWFRYSCVLLLRNGQDEDTLPVDNRFEFPKVRDSLKTADVLGPLHQSLQRDYDVMNYLLHHAAGLELDSIEGRLLVLDYKVMQAVYWATRTTAPNQARRALSEMAAVLGILTQRMSEQAGIRNQA